MNIKHPLLYVSMLFVWSLAGQTKELLHTSKIASKHGDITINLPNKIHAGDMISGTVSTKPKGSNPNKMAKATTELANYTVVFDATSWNTSLASQQVTVPNNSNGTLNIKVIDAKGTEVGSFPIAVNPSPREITATYNGSPAQAYLRAGYPAISYGDFDGNASNTVATLGNTPLTILTESPDAIVYQLPANISEPSVLSITENGFSSTEIIPVIDTDLTVDKLDLSKGEQTMLHLQLSGLQHLDDPVKVTLENLTPENVHLEGGIHQEITIDPNTLDADGLYKKDFGLRAHKAGGFNILCTLDPPPPLTNDEDDPIEKELDSLPGLTDPFMPKRDIPVTKMVFDSDPNGTNTLINYTVDPNENVEFFTVVPDEVVQEERNKARNIPGSTSLNPRDPNDHESPYSRPVPSGIKGDKVYRGSTWRDADKLLDRAKSQVTKAENHEGPLTFGTPGYTTISTFTPSVTTSTTSSGVTCTESVYKMSVNYFYINDRTLLHEEQLSPSEEFFVAEGSSKIDVTETETGWEVGATGTATSGAFEVEVSGKYWEKTTKIKGKGSSKLKGRMLWLFHVGRLYLVRRAFLKIDYEYHHVTCSDGTSRNWVNVSYTDNWAYWYEWEEELFVAKKNDEGHFTRIDGFPETKNTDTNGGDSESYEVDDLDQGNFRNPHSSGFYPNN